jgi:flavocytochrome c
LIQTFLIRTKIVFNLHVFSKEVYRENTSNNSDKSIYSRKTNYKGAEIMTSQKSVSRRDFLKGAAVGAVALSSSGLLAGCAPTATTTTLPKKWDKEADIVVVGFGGAGAAVAIAARKAGSSVVILEKREVAGGSTAICGGVYYASNTSVQKANGIVDTADKMYQHYINAGKGFNNPKLVRLAADKSAENVELLISLGADMSTPPTVSGAEYNVGSEPIARVHSTIFGDLSGGGAYFAVLEKGAKDAGAEVLMETPATKLIIDAAGQVVGVKADNAGTEMNIKAKKGVVITTGGFTRSEEMLYAFTMQGHYCQPLGAPGLDGDGHKMAFELGAATDNISEILGIPGITLPGAGAATYALWTFMMTVPAIMVNNDGMRFVDEYKFYDWKNTELLKQPDHVGFSVFDVTTRDTYKGAIVAGFSEDLAKEVTDGTVLKADTIAGLAKAMGVPAAKLEATVAKWNEDSAAGTDTLWGRTSGFGKIETAPFYAFKTFPTMFDNSGGLKINENAQVINVRGEAIGRLYAAGQVAGGVIGEHYPGSGTALNAGITFGLIAGTHASGLQAWG